MQQKIWATSKLSEQILIIRKNPSFTSNLTSCWHILKSWRPKLLVAYKNGDHWSSMKIILQPLSCQLFSGAIMWLRGGLKRAAAVRWWGHCPSTSPLLQCSNAPLCRDSWCIWCQGNHQNPTTGKPNSSCCSSVQKNLQARWMRWLSPKSENITHSLTDQSRWEMLSHLKRNEGLSVPCEQYVIIPQSGFLGDRGWGKNPHVCWSRLL